MKRVMLSTDEIYNKITDGFNEHTWASELQRYQQRVVNAIHNVHNHHLITQTIIDDLPDLSTSSVSKALFKNIPPISVRVCYLYSAFVYVLLSYCGYSPKVVIGCAYDTSRIEFKNTKDVVNHVWIESEGDIYENFTGVTNIDYRKAVEEFTVDLS